MILELILGISTVIMSTWFSEWIGLWEDFTKINEIVLTIDPNKYEKI
jgi:hypothetical protein